MTLRFKITEWFLRWMCSWVALVDGITGIITFANWNTSWQLKVATWLAQYRAKAINPNKFMKEVVEQQHRIQGKRRKE